MTFPGSIVVPPVYPDPTFQNVNTVPFGYAYGEGNAALDHTDPSVPTGLAASAVTATGVTLDWNAARDDIKVDHYNVYRNGAAEASPSTPHVVLSDLTTKTTYSFTVTAVDENDNESAPSTAVSVTTS